jgi:hypothetical protein
MSPDRFECAGLIENDYISFGAGAGSAEGGFAFFVSGGGAAL